MAIFSYRNALIFFFEMKICKPGRRGDEKTSGAKKNNNRTTKSQAVSGHVMLRLGPKKRRKGESVRDISNALKNREK